MFLALILHPQNFNNNSMATNNEIRREWRFYVCLCMGFCLMFCGFYVPPLGVISNSVIIAAGMLLCIGAMAVGIDLKGCIHELRLLKRETEDTLKEDGKED